MVGGTISVSANGRDVGCGAPRPTDAWGRDPGLRNIRCAHVAAPWADIGSPHSGLRMRIRWRDLDGTSLAAQAGEKSWREMLALSAHPFPSPAPPHRDLARVGEQLSGDAKVNGSASRQ